MRKVTLIFADTSSLADFLLTHNIAKAEICSSEQSLTSVLTEDEIIKACTEFSAVLKRNNSMSIAWLPSFLLIVSLSAS